MITGGGDADVRGTAAEVVDHVVASLVLQWPLRWAVAEATAVELTNRLFDRERVGP